MPYKPIEQVNKEFQAKNPQYFTPPKQVAAVGAYNPMGTTAKSPAMGMPQTPNIIPTAKANIPAPQTGITPPPQQSNTPSFPGTVGSLLRTATEGTPEVQQANNNLLNFKNSYARYQNAVGTEPNPFGFQTGVGRLAADRYSMQLPAYEQAVSNSLTSQGQRLSSTGQAASLSAPQQVSPGNFYVNPLTGQDVSGGNINPGAGGARMAQVTQGGQAQNNVPLINSGATAVNDVNRILQQGGFNPSDLNVVNLWNNIVNSNTSNPLYAQLQRNFNTAVNFYAQVLGQDPNELISSLASTGKGSSLAEALRTLDAQARSYNQSLFESSRGNNVGAQVQPMPQQQAQSPAIQTNGQTSGGNSYQVIPD